MKLFHTATVKVRSEPYPVLRTFHFTTTKARNDFISTAYLEGLIEVSPSINCDHLMSTKEALSECRRTQRRYEVDYGR